MTEVTRQALTTCLIRSVSVNCHCGETPEKNNLMKERLLALSVRGFRA
jgi:hypothetical protein